MWYKIMRNFNSLGCLVLEISTYQYEACHGFRFGASVHKLFVGGVIAKHERPSNEFWCYPKHKYHTVFFQQSCPKFESSMTNRWEIPFIALDIGKRKRLQNLDKTHGPLSVPPCLPLAHFTDRFSFVTPIFISLAKKLSPRYSHIPYMYMI